MKIPCVTLQMGASTFNITPDAKLTLRPASIQSVDTTLDVITVMSPPTLQSAMMVTRVLKIPALTKELTQLDARILPTTPTVPVLEVLAQPPFVIHPTLTIPTTRSAQRIQQVAMELFMTRIVRLEHLAILPLATGPRDVNTLQVMLSAKHRLQIA